MVGSPAALRGYKSIHNPRSHGTRNLQSYEAIVIGAGSKLDGARALDGAHHDFRHHIRDHAAVERWPTWQGGNSGVARCKARPLRRQRAIGRTGANGDPVSAVA